MQTWQEAVEQKVCVPLQAVGGHFEKPLRYKFAFAATEVHDPEISPTVGIRRRQEVVSGFVEIAAQAIDAAVAKVTVRVVNSTPLPDAAPSDPDAVLMRTFASTHTLLHVRDGEFLSLLDPPAGAYSRRGGLPEHRRLAGAGG